VREREGERSSPALNRRNKKKGNRGRERTRCNFIPLLPSLWRRKEKNPKKREEREKRNQNKIFNCSALPEEGAKEAGRGGEKKRRGGGGNSSRFPRGGEPAAKGGSTDEKGVDDGGWRERRRKGRNGLVLLYLPF